MLQQELHDLAGGHGPEFDLQEHLPQPPGTSQAAAQQVAADGQCQQAQQAERAAGLQPMATE